jgi:hypothetical protein
MNSDSTKVSITNLQLWLIMSMLLGVCQMLRYNVHIFVYICIYLCNRRLPEKTSIFWIFIPFLFLEPYSLFIVTEWIVCLGI